VVSCGSESRPLLPRFPVVSWGDVYLQLLLLDRNTLYGDVCGTAFVIGCSPSRRESNSVPLQIEEGLLMYIRYRNN
jgi:hypothetical protein